MDRLEKICIALTMFNEVAVPVLGLGAALFLGVTFAIQFGLLK